MNLLSVVLPYVALALLIAGLLYRRVAPASTANPMLRDLPPETALPLAVGGAIVALGPIAGLLVPGLVRALIASPSRLLFVESLRLLGGLLFAWGLLQLLVRAARTPRDATLAASARGVATALLLFLTVSGLYLTATVRWSSAWYVELVVPYLRSLLRLSPDATIFAQLPLMLRLHVLGVFTLLAVWPFARLTSELRSMLRQLPGSSSPTPDGTASTH